MNLKVKFNVTFVMYLKAKLFLKSTAEQEWPTYVNISMEIYL